MEVWTTEPGVQFYAGHYVDARRTRAWAAAATRPLPASAWKPQIWPDSPNRPYFPQAVLWPGEIYRQMTEYRFRLP